MTAGQPQSQASQLAAVAQYRHESARTLWALWVLFWLLMIVVAVQDHWHDGGIRLWEPILWEGSSALVATCLLLLQRRVAPHYDQYLDQPLRWIAHHVKWLPLMVVGFTGVAYGIRHAVYGALGETYHHDPWTFVLVYETVKIGLFVGLWLGIIFGLNSYAQWQAQRQRLTSLQKTLAEAQLAQLKAQLRPHFFFNALNTISALMHVDVARADRLLTRLGDLLRASLYTGGQEMTTLKEELHVLELYAQIMQERFADRVTLSWQIEPGTLHAAVPILLLQPLLENAFKHAVERSSGPVEVRIKSERRGAELCLSVCNTGSTLQDSRGPGVGIRNCCERLRVIYDERASFSLVQDDGAVQARVVLPWQEHAA